jgi:hypothetical protein
LLFFSIYFFSSVSSRFRPFYFGIRKFEFDFEFAGLSLALILWVCLLLLLGFLYSSFYFRFCFIFLLILDGDLNEGLRLVMDGFESGD